MAHVCSNEPPAADEQSVREMEKVCRRAEDALSSARERIATWQGSKGELLAELVHGRSMIDSSSNRT